MQHRVERATISLVIGFVRKAVKGKLKCFKLVCDERALQGGNGFRLDVRKSCCEVGAP